MVGSNGWLTSFVQTQFLQFKRRIVVDVIEIKQWQHTGMRIDRLCMDPLCMGSPFFAKKYSVRKRASYKPNAFDYRIA
jgi:hypothetical protein